MFSHCGSELITDWRNLPEGLCLGFFSLHVQQILREKLMELQALMVEEQRLTRGERTTSLPFLMLVKSAVNF